MDNLKEISNFIKKNNSYSDFNIVNNFLCKLNYTKLSFNKLVSLELKHLSATKILFTKILIKQFIK